MNLLADQPRGNVERSRCKRRKGIQLLELIISMSVSSLLVAGVASSIYLASEGQQLAISTREGISQDLLILNQLRSDLSEAKSFSSVSNNYVQFTVADRDADGVDEVLQYQWMGNALEYSWASGQWANLTDQLQYFDIQFPTTQAQTTTAGLTLEPPGLLHFVSQTDAKATRKGLFGLPPTGVDLTVSTPATHQAGDLLVAAIAVEHDQAGSIAVASPWTKIFEQQAGGNISLAVFYSTSSPGTSSTFTWPNNAASYCVIAHFRSPTGTCYLDSFSSATANSATPPAPLVNFTNNNALAIRVVATDHSLIPEYGTNMPGYLPVFFKGQLIIGPSIGMTFRHFATAGTVPATNFNLPSAKDAVTGTVVFNP